MFRKYLFLSSCDENTLNVTKMRVLLWTSDIIHCDAITSASATGNKWMMIGQDKIRSESILEKVCMEHIDGIFMKFFLNQCRVWGGSNE